MIVLRKPVLSKKSVGVVVADELSGERDGINKVFHTTHTYKRDRITVYYNGQALHAPYDFEQTGENEITFVDIIPQYEDEKLRATYELEGSDYGPVLKGRQPIPVGVYKKRITFGVSLLNSFYSLSTELFSADGSPSIYNYIIGEKTVDGFTVFFSGIIDTPNYIFEWAVSP